MAHDSEDLLNPDEIEALLNASNAGKPSGGAKPPPADAAPPAGGGGGNLLDPSEIEALLQQSGDSASSGTSGGSSSPGESVPSTSLAGSTSALLDQAEADLAAAIAPQMDHAFGIPAELGEPNAFQFREFGDPTKSGETGSEGGLAAIKDVELDLRIELGRTELLIEEVLRLAEGSVVPLDKLAGDPVDILVNGRLIARGEVLVLNDNFCVRVAEILTPDY